MNPAEDFDSLRTNLLALVAEKLTPVALHYGYSEVPLETNIKWRPQVLVLGNYSSGKSALINEFLGAEVQATGQAPTDDSFTVLTYDDAALPAHPIRMTEDRDGKFLLNNSEYPFERLKRHGERFAAHFRLKKVNSPFLKTLAVIDTPGMLDSISERDRGYNYQDVIGDLANMADLVLVLFDPHKAGTVREAHISLRDTLPLRTFEDRVLFVLNRIDECASLIDLLRVYGTLCWNLSQITGRKDIPLIHLTYSARAAAENPNGQDKDRSFLHQLENQRQDLKDAILQAPRHRLDNLATFVETHGERLTHLLESLLSYRQKLRRLRLRHLLIGMGLSLLAGSAAALLLVLSELLAGMSIPMFCGIAGALALVCMTCYATLLWKTIRGRWHRKRLRRLDELTVLDSQTRRDSWDAVKDLAHAYLKRTGGRFAGKDVKADYAVVRSVYETGSKEIREALNELPAAVNPVSSSVGSAGEAPAGPGLNAL